MDSPAFSRLHDVYVDFCQSQSSSMARFWQSYMDMVSLLLRFIRATRQGDWELHKACVRDMLPWIFAYDRIHYARYMSAYWSQMSTLSSTHPHAHQALTQGEFGAQRSGVPFAQVPIDQTIEQTINRHCKTSGGIVGFSTKPSATQRWLLAAHDRAEATSSCHRLAGIGDDRQIIHKDRSNPRIQRD